MEKTEIKVNLPEEIKEEPQEQKKDKEQENQSQNNGDNEKELLLSGGGGAVAFLAGYIHGLVNIVGKEKLKEYKIGGVSAGASISFFTHVVINQDEYDMKYFFKEWIRKLYEKENKKYYGFCTSGQRIRAFLPFLDDLKKKNNMGPLTDKLHVAITTFNRFGIPRREIVSEFFDDADMCETVIASCNIPYLIDPKFFADFRGRKALDGGICTVIPNRFENSKKVFLNLSWKHYCKFPFVWKWPKNLDIIHIGESDRKLSYPKDFLMYDEHWADEMFDSGTNAANADRETLLKLVK